MLPDYTEKSLNPEVGDFKGLPGGGGFWGKIWQTRSSQVQRGRGEPGKVIRKHKGLYMKDCPFREWKRFGVAPSLTYSDFLEKWPNKQEQKTVPHHVYFFETLKLQSLDPLPRFSILPALVYQCNTWGQWNMYESEWMRNLGKSGRKKSMKVKISN